MKQTSFSEYISSETSAGATRIDPLPAHPIMRKVFTLLAAALMLALRMHSGFSATAAGLEFSNGLGLHHWNPIEIKPAASTGLEAVYVLETLSNKIAVSFEANGTAPASTVKWQRFGNLGGGFAEDVAARVEGNRSVIDAATSSQVVSSDGIGYIVEYEGKRHCFWAVNYLKNECRLGPLSISPEEDCARTTLQFDGSARKITYYSVNGVQQTLPRDMQLRYNTLVYNEEQQRYEQKETTLSLDYADALIRVDAPLCDTEFTLTADRFERQWYNELPSQHEHWIQEVTSPVCPAHAVAAVTRAVQTLRDNDNEQKEESGAMGGSGPVEVQFTADVTDAVVFREWQFASDAQFDIIDLRIQELDVTHTFRDYGTTYVRFIAGNNAGTCDFTGETYEVHVGESRLECPNAFSPGTSEGTNDEWKVSYKSIIEFDCHIFNRWGQEMAHLADPSQGWDGRYKGKLVPSGVYYYVIKAVGADGKRYKLSGDINILKSRNNTNNRPTE